MEQELRFGLDLGPLALLKKKKIWDNYEQLFRPVFFQVFSIMTDKIGEVRPPVSVRGCVGHPMRSKWILEDQGQMPTSPECTNNFF